MGSDLNQKQIILGETKDAAAIALLDVLEEKYQHRRFYSEKNTKHYERANMRRTATSIGYAATPMYFGVRILEILPSVAPHCLTLKFHMSPELLYGTTWAMTVSMAKTTTAYFESDGTIVLKYDAREVHTACGLVAGLQELELVMPVFELYDGKDAIVADGF
jgi:hypothetical protein